MQSENKKNPRTMKLKATYILCGAALSMLALAGCSKFDYDTPDVLHDIYMSDTEATGTTTTLAAVKEAYRENITGNQHFWTKVTEDVIFDGYVCANDITGNIYQSIYVRSGDDAISIGINDNSLWTTYPVGTHVKVNLNGLYIGSYGNLAKIGAPYTTTGGNKRLGGMTKFKAPTHIEVIGFNKDAYEVQPVLVDNDWLAQKASNTYQMHKWSPMLVRVENAEIKGYNNRKVYAVYDDRDAGNGVNNTIILDGKNYTLRQSALSSFSSEPIPQGKVNVTAVLTRYGDTWQFTLRSADDVTPAE